MDVSGNGRPEPIRVLRVIARLNVGGPALHVAYLSQGLAERGYETTLVAGDVARGEASMAFVAAERGVEVVRIPGLSREISPLADLRATLRLADLIRELRPHVLHTHTAKAGAIGRLAALLAGRARPAVVVHTFHGHVLKGYFGALGTGLFRLVERALARTSDALVAVSPEIRDELVAIGVAPASRFAVVRLGIGLEERVGAPADRREVLRRIGIADGRFVVGWFGRMTAVKRTTDLVDVLASLRDRGVDAVLLLVGDGTDREQVEQHALERGVARHCFFLGYQEEVARWYAACDAVVLTSESEGTPVILIEALAAGRPVVSYDVGGVRDVVRDGVDGVVVRPRDVEAMAAALQSLAGDPELARRLGKSGRRRVLARYAVPRLVGDVDRLYRALLEASTSSSSRR
mgnify:CR=1 FL=1